VVRLYIAYTKREEDHGVGLMTRHERDSESGYVLLGIVILLVILGIGMGAAVPVWQHVMQREKEEELIWRGFQYAQAIERYQKKYPGAFPPNLEVLVKEKFLRKLYKDPMKDGSGSPRQLSPN
jgi:type II secretory pathway pseudopilin PulG